MQTVLGSSHRNSMQPSKRILEKSPPGTHKHSAKPYLFFLMVAMIVLVYVFLIAGSGTEAGSHVKSISSKSLR